MKADYDCSVFNRGKGGAAGSVNYLMGRDRCREGAKLLRGNADE
ncbi:hypothetical protein SALWKB12_1716 [Snodgrassella communis]|nr:hypothetical protein SALWKB12_1716 [Snodgrassella communis]